VTARVAALDRTGLADRAELIRALAILSEPPQPEHAHAAAALGLPPAPEPSQYVDLFLLQAYPYASVYLGSEGMMGGEARDRAAGFWRALGLVPPTEPDHLAALLGLYASVMDAERQEADAARAVLRRASLRALLWEHLLSWCPLYLDKVAAIAPAFYRAWARLLRRTLLDEGARLGSQAELPLALRSAGPLPDVCEAPEAWVAALLAPVRSGVIVTRSDLRRCAGRLQLGMRLGERAFILRALLEQDPGGTVAWLAGEAEGSSRRAAALEPALGDVARFWRDRARSSAAALRAVLSPAA
jgi:TorA maturation chaperone TorD